MLTMTACAIDISVTNSGASEANLYQSEPSWSEAGEGFLDVNGVAMLAADDTAEASCGAASTTWGDEMYKYAVWHAKALVKLRAAAAAVGKVGVGAGAGVGLRRQGLPRLSVYRFDSTTSWIGFGDAIAGLSNVFLSAVRRRRVFLLDWPGQRALASPESGLETVGVDWEALLPAYRGNASRAKWYVIDGTPTMEPPNVGPQLWPAAGTTRGGGADVEISEHFNRGALTVEGGAGERAAADTMWLTSVLPFADDNIPRYGCVYRAVFSIARALRRAAARRVPLPIGGGRLVCAHVRTFNFNNVVIPVEATMLVSALLDCLAETVTRQRADAVFVASDSLAVRAAARTAMAGKYTYYEAPDRPKHIAYMKNAAPAEREAALGTALQDWWLLSLCPFVVTTQNTGFSRTALAMGGGQPVISANDAIGDTKKNICVKVQRDWGADKGAGW